MLARTAIRSAAEAFWSAAGGRAAYDSPVKLDRAVVRTLPIAIHHVAGLTTAHIAPTLGRIGASIATGGPARPLRGCLVADVGVGLIFVAVRIRKTSSG